MKINVLDHGFVRVVECWGHGDAGNNLTDGHENNTPTESDDNEVGIIEAARQSTQKSFLGWDDRPCPEHLTPWCPTSADDAGVVTNCKTCNGKGTVPGDKKLLSYLHANNHATPFEFSGMVIEVRAPIFVFREWHRHRTQSYNEMSARYAPLPDVNYVPSADRCLYTDPKNKQAGKLEHADVLTESGAERWMKTLTDLYRQAEAVYATGLAIGVPKELARLCLPAGRYSQMRASANLRNWLEFYTLRASTEAQWEIRQYADAVGQIIAQQFPRTWALMESKNA